MMGQLLPEGGVKSCSVEVLCFLVQAVVYFNVCIMPGEKLISDPCVEKVLF